MKGIMRRIHSVPQVLQTKHPEFDVRLGGLWLKVIVAPDLKAFTPIIRKWSDPVEFADGFEFPFAWAKKDHVVVDPRYFAFIGFVRSRLCYPIVAHECFHAAYDYVRRQRRGDAFTFDLKEEEDVAMALQTLVFKVCSKLLRIGAMSQREEKR